jgi:hypothetical protein
LINYIISELHDKNSNEYYKSKNGTQVYKAKPKSHKITGRDYRKAFKQYSKQLEKEKIEEIKEELILVG